MTDKAVQGPIDERGAEVMDAQLSATELASIETVRGFLRGQRDALEADPETSGIVADCWADLDEVIGTHLAVFAVFAV